MTTDDGSITRYMILTVDDAKTLARLAFVQGARVEALVDRVNKDEGAPIQEIVDDLKGLGPCVACAHESMERYCVSIEAQRCGRRLRRLLEIARGERRPWQKGGSEG
jgi:hypothetical protein